MDFRFIGDSIDYIIFDNYTKIKDEKDLRTPITITFVEVKTVKSATLKSKQKKIKEAIENGRVVWETIQKPHNLHHQDFQQIGSFQAVYVYLPTIYAASPSNSKG